MNTPPSNPSNGSTPSPAPQPPPSQPVVIQQTAPAGAGRRWITRLLLAALMISVLFNITLWSKYQDYFAPGIPIQEKYQSGEKLAEAKIAVIEVDGTIMSPFTDRILEAIKRAREDDAVKAVVLSIDSPGGMVADSHRIYHKLRQLSREKPIAVSMKSMAASGGYYLAMGAGPEGKIFAEPATWTGSIGVIIPRFNLTRLSEKIGVDSDPLKTGEFKDALSPFRELSEKERELWMTILNDAFERFLKVIAENREPLDKEAVKQLATGQVYTAEQAKQHKLIDTIGYEEDAIEDLKGELGLEEVRVVRYEFQPALLEMLTGGMSASREQVAWRKLLDATVPRAMYYCSWAPAFPAE